MEGYAPGRECLNCKGKCCKEKGCSLSPEDMLKSLQKRNAGNRTANLTGETLYRGVLSMLTDEKGMYAVDYFSSKEGPLFYLRMKHKCYTFIGIDAIGECVALTENGCMLSEDERPKGGRFLESNEKMQCIQHYTREMMWEDWKPYQEILSLIWKEYKEKFENDGTFESCDNEYFQWMKSQREKNQTKKA
ncbi:MAG: hypothetical protein ACI4SD_07730 [Suilimivivens sp.]